jgi:carboxymethylenebutenolidase
MKRRLTLRFALPLVCLSLACSALFAQNGQEVSIPSGAESVRAILYQPTGKFAQVSGKHPGLIVIHEWWGLNDWVKQQSQEFAGEGYVTLAVDLYRGKVATDSETAHELMRGLPQDRGIRSLTAAATWLGQQPGVDPHRIGAIGWCMGGGFAAQLAVADPSLNTVIINYGALPTDPGALAQIHAAVLGNFGGLDQGITPGDVHAFAAAMQSLGKPVDVKIYADAGHAFENPSNATGYRPADTQDAQARYRRFLAEHLRPELMQ